MTKAPIVSRAGAVLLGCVFATGWTAPAWSEPRVCVDPTAAGGAAPGTQSATGINSVACGAGASASADNSVALGQGSNASRANTVSVGADGAGVKRQIVNVADGVLDSDAATVGQLNGFIGAVDAVVNVGFAAQSRAVLAQMTADQALSGVNAALPAISALQASDSAQDGRLTALESSVGNLLSDRRDTRAGIAAAMALGGTMVLPDDPVTISFNLATYHGEQGFSGSVVGRIAPRVYVNAGFAGSTRGGSNGGRVGIAFGFGGN